MMPWIFLPSQRLGKGTHQWTLGTASSVCWSGSISVIHRDSYSCRLLPTQWLEHMEWIQAWRKTTWGFSAFDCYILYHPTASSKNSGKTSAFLEELEIMFTFMALSIVPHRWRLQVWHSLKSRQTGRIRYVGYFWLGWTCEGTHAHTHGHGLGTSYQSSCWQVCVLSEGKANVNRWPPLCWLCACYDCALWSPMNILKRILPTSTRNFCKNIHTTLWVTMTQSYERSLTNMFLPRT